jgi:exosortase
VPPEAARPPRGYFLLAGALAVLFLALLAALFAGRFFELYLVWRADDNYSHGFLVPLVSAYLAWEIYQRQGLTGKGSLPGGLFLIALGVLAHLASVVVWWPLLDFLALTSILFGTAVLVGGRAWARGFAFPILFLFFMFPLPTAFIDQVAVWLQGVVTPAAAFVLRMFVPVYRQGNFLYLPGTPLEVGEACSGLRQAIAFPALGLLVAYVTPRGLGFRAALVLSTLPVAVAANLLRILLMAFIVLHFGYGWISEQKMLVFNLSYHSAWGLLTFTLGLGLFLGVRWWLTRVLPPGKAEKPAAAPDGVPSGKSGGGLDLPRIVRHLGGAVALLVAAVALQGALGAHLRAADAVSVPELTKSLSGFPVSLGEWSGQEATPGPATLPYYNAANDKLNRKYLLPGGGADGADLRCDLWMVHFKDGRDRRHHPLVCCKVEGYEEEPRRHSAVDMEDDGPPVQRFCFTARGIGIYVYYWHYTLEPGDSEGLSPLQRLHQEFGLRRPSLTVQVWSWGRTEAELEAADAFVRAVDRELQGYLPPGGARRGSETVPITVIGPQRAPATR